MAQRGHSASGIAVLEALPWETAARSKKIYSFQALLFAGCVALTLLDTYYETPKLHHSTYCHFSKYSQINAINLLARPDVGNRVVKWNVLQASQIAAGPWCRAMAARFHISVIVDHNLAFA